MFMLILHCLESSDGPGYSDMVAVEWSTDGTSWNEAGILIFVIIQYRDGKTRASYYLISALNQTALVILPFNLHSNFGVNCYDGNIQTVWFKALLGNNWLLFFHPWYCIITKISTCLIP